MIYALVSIHAELVAQKVQA